MNKIPDPCLFESSLLFEHPYACHQQRGTQRKPLRIGLACTLLKLKSFQSKRYLKGIPFSPSLQASVSMAKYIRLRDVKALINSISHWEWIRKLAIILDPCKHTIVKLLHIAMNLSGQQKFTIILQSPSRLTLSNALVRSKRSCTGPHSVPGISFETVLL